MTEQYDIFVRDFYDAPIKSVKQYDQIEPWIKQHCNEKLHYVVKHKQNGHYRSVTPQLKTPSGIIMMNLANNIIEQWSHVRCMCHHGWRRFDYGSIKEYKDATSDNPSYHSNYDDEGNNVTKARLEGSFGKLFR